MPHLAVTLERPPTVSGFIGDADRWPMHATLLQSFLVDSSVDTVAALVRDRAEGTGLVTAIGDHEEGFGPDRDIRVTVLGDAQQLVALHEALLADFGALPGFAPDVPEWTGEGYRPHVTAGPWGALEPGDAVAFDRIAVVDVGTADGRPRVAAVVSLVAPEEVVAGG
jgi:hypothetical protein